MVYRDIVKFGTVIRRRAGTGRVCSHDLSKSKGSMTITKRGVSTLLVFVIPLVAFAPLAGSAGPLLGSAHRLALPNASTVTNTGPTMRNRSTAPTHRDHH